VKPEMIRFVKVTVFSKFNSSFLYVSRPTQLLKYTRFVSFVFPSYLRALQFGGPLHVGDFQEIVDNSFEVVALDRVQPVILRIPFYE